MMACPVSVVIGVPCVNTICFIYSCAVISTPALVRGDSQGARKGGCSSSARSLIQRSTQVDFITYRQQFYRAMTSDFCYPAYGDLSLDDKPNLSCL
ncbi:hypothetical protein OUZ56_016540 [Daphnia magna]|uniref:Secreted protein n=1 Tax=Daphnia magna TaxID=35525 RepID=A0ABR0AQU6_9CRUS|nr:hypothetical protein OUZ56_016540 [Daphnia magna]